MARTVHCIKLNKEAEGLDFPPVPGEMGKKLYLSVSKEAWQAWLKHQTMLINENRLNLADDRARKYLATPDGKAFLRRRRRPGDGLRAAAPVPRGVSTQNPRLFSACRWSNAAGTPPGWPCTGSRTAPSVEQDVEPGGVGHRLDHQHAVQRNRNRASLPIRT
jgi:Fe-S cluster biosynthesis and repair protein YggX